MAKSKTGWHILVTMLIVGAYLTSGRPVFAQDTGWGANTFAALQRLVDERTALPAVLEPYVDTSESKHGTIPIIVQISTNIPPGRYSVIAGGSRVSCECPPVRGGNRIPATCYRLLTPEGADFKIKATVYGRDGLPGIPADGIKPNGALLADHAKELVIYLDEVVSVGVLGGPPWAQN